MTTPIPPKPAKPDFRADLDALATPHGVTKVSWPTLEASPLDVAMWMADSIKTTGLLYEEDSVLHVRGRFGKRFTYTNEHGHISIAKHVLDALDHISGDDFVWSRSNRAWSRRKDHHVPGRFQD